ncbi:syndecan-2-like [Denticeps clupeoides]|uniref:syndecan-2-like n=1 Tax=Denticeps clupeoides TaxID=299321 RepID=UPI0010A40CA0|nr:syndecan-2-like [Denticeps clupeoides]
MRIPSVNAVVCICLWIHCALSLPESLLEDQDSSGDLEVSGSGIGEEGPFSETTVIPSSVTETTGVSVTDAPVRIPEQTTTLLSLILSNQSTPTTAEPIVTTVLPQSTSSITSAQPSQTTGIGEAHQDDTTTTSQTTNEATESVGINTDDDFVIPEDSTNLFEEMLQTTTPTLMNGEDDDLEKYLGWTTELSTEATTTTASSEPSAEEEEASGVTTVLPTEEFVTEAVEFLDNEIIPVIQGKAKSNFNEMPDLSENEILDGASLPNSAENKNLLEKKEVLAGVIAGGVVGLAFAVMLVALMVYRMKKKDEGSYALDEQKQPNGGYQKPQRQEEFLA